MPALGSLLKPGNMVKSVWNGNLTFCWFPNDEIHRGRDAFILWASTVVLLGVVWVRGREQLVYLLTNVTLQHGRWREHETTGCPSLKQSPSTTFLVVSDPATPLSVQAAPRETEANNQSLKRSKLTSRKVLLRKIQIWVRMGRLRTKEGSFLIYTH